MNTSIKPENDNQLKQQLTYPKMEKVPNQDSFNHGKVLKRVQSPFINKETGNMPREFGVIKPEKITHSRTMTP